MKNMFVIGLIFQDIFTGVFNTIYVDYNYRLTSNFKNAVPFSSVSHAEKAFKKHKQDIFFDSNRFPGKLKEIRVFQVALAPVATLADVYNFNNRFIEE